MRNETRRDRRKVWLNKLISLARQNGDTRPRSTIAQDVEDFSSAVSKAFREAHRDREKGETVALGNYKKAGIERGEVLTRTVVYAHPCLMPPRIVYIHPALTHLEL